MKGIILHGGHGTRLRPLTHTGPKQLLPIANKPMSQYALEDLRDAGIKDIAIIIGDVYPEKVKEVYENGEKFNVNISYIYQEKPLGISHAIQLCKKFVGDEKFVVYLGDNILRSGLKKYVKKFSSSKSDSMILLSEVDDPSRFGVVEIENKKILKIVEKPKRPKSNLIAIGVYFLTPKIFEIIKKLKPSWRGELEISDAIQLMLKQKMKVDYDIVTGWWKDTGTPEDIIHANKLTLNTITTGKKKIILGKNTSISRDCLLIGPIIIGDHCNIGPAVQIGPYVSIGNNCTLKKCHIENSIIMDNSKIDNKIWIKDSIIAHSSEILENNEDEKVQFLLGERTQIKF